ncbi:killer cell lectin-like receptor subfamily B member 1B allele B [Mauremys mutica]|uniref:killer cell lectin-like receptor subfamily B member 1B allele B n=1 Tax=Mauremys mutica TaxID=74926 RepID=UPI001D16DBE3|nr:killer cell lectin-like receptor subfamily B member 1B allele B [Mauremys mutica]
MFHQTLTLPGHPQCPRWHRMALGVGWAGNIVLLGAVVAMGLWGNFKSLGNDSANERPSYGYNCSTELKDFPFCFKQFLCEPPSSNSREGSGCKLCPPNWLLHRDKCYWVSKEKTPWDKSRDDCSKRSARLLTIRDQDEMAFIQTTSKDANRIWLGLTITFPARKRIWVDGSLLNQTLFKVVDPAEGNSCGVIKADRIHFETCSAVSKWICEKDALLI